MSLEERVYSTLLVSAAEQFNYSLHQLLPESKYHPVHVVTSISIARQHLANRAYDFIIIHAPLPDDTGLQFAIDVSSSQNTVVLLLVRTDIYEEVHSKMVSHGIFTLSRPTTKSTISVALKWMESTRERLRKFEKKTLSIEEKMEEIRLVNRAKWLLIVEQRMTEPEAHRYIEKQAMDQCIHRREIAMHIISQYAEKG